MGESSSSMDVADKSRWGVFHYKQDDDPLVATTDLTNFAQSATNNITTQQYITGWSSIPIGNWIPYISDNSDWHLRT